MEIYADVLFLENLVINHLILFVTSRLSGKKVSSARIFIGALIGAAYVLLLLFLPENTLYYSLPAKLLLSVFIVAVVFAPPRIGDFLKTTAVFYTVTFMFAGAAFCLIYFSHGGGFVRNGMFYFPWDSTLMMLLLSAATALIAAGILVEIFRDRRVKERQLIPLRIMFQDNTVSMPALIDTGNSLRDPLTDRPVIVVEFMALRQILPCEIREIYEKRRENDLDTVTGIISGSAWFSRFRLIPFNSIGRENGLMLGFKPDYVEVGENEDKRGMTDTIIGICNRNLSRNNSYRALLAPELVWLTAEGG